MKQSAVEWLVNEITTKYDKSFLEFYRAEVEQAKKIEKQEEDKIYDHAFSYGRLTTEISDEEIKKWAFGEKYNPKDENDVNFFLGAKFYRELSNNLKKKSNELTPQEKGKLLIHDFYLSLPNNGSLTSGPNSCESRWKEAVTCALKSVEHIMDALCDNGSWDSVYWEQVKKEIEKF